MANMTDGLESNLDDSFLALYPDLRVSCGPVTLRVPRLRDALKLAHIAHTGLFPEGTSTLGEWYNPQDPTSNARSVLSYQYLAWAQVPAPPLRMPFAVLEGDTVVGTQSLEDSTGKFLTTREMGTGSWLDPIQRGRGLGTLARYAALAFGFEVLNAQTMVTGALLDNAASNAVSRKCGYSENGLQVRADGGKRIVLQRYIMTKEQWQNLKRPAVEITGHESLAEVFN
jgi:RimJ/RimL family protein N-acetyltransferase